MYTPEKENTIQRKWLASFYIYAFWALLNSGFSLATTFCTDAMNNKMHKNSEDVILLLLAFTLILGTLFLPYYFGYKKRGTCLLAWVTIIGGLKFISKIPETISEIKSSFIDFGLNNLIINIYYVLTIGGIFIVTYYLISSWKLYSLNHNIKYGNKKQENVSI